MTRFSPLTSLVLVVVLVSVGCGLRVDSEPRALPPSELPADLLDADPGLLPSDEERTAVVYMIGPDERLIPVGRFVEFAPDVSTQARLLMETLIAGTFPTEVREGITTAINRATEVTSVLDAGGGVAFVDLSNDTILSLSFDEQEAAYAQIVYTLTELPEIDRLIFSIGDRFIGVPTDVGVSRPGDSVSRDDFESLDPERPSVSFPTEDDAVTPEDTSPTPGSESPDNPVAPTPVPAIPEDVPTVVLPTVDPAFDLIVWLLDSEGRLVPRPRQIERSPRALVQSLLLGPAEGESETGIRTAIRSTATLVSIDDDDTQTAFVNLGPDSLPPVTGDLERRRAVAQIVFTLTELAEIDAVTILIGGERLPMPTDSGFSESGATLVRSDFASLAPPVVGVPPLTVSPTPTGDDARGADGATTPAPGATPPADEIAAPTPAPSPTPTPTPGP